MMQFLGLVTYNKNFVPNFSGLVAPLRALVTHTDIETRLARQMPQPASAQKAELMAIIESCKLAKDKTANAVQAVHIDLCHWRRKCFVTLAGTPVKHLSHLLGLYFALLVP